VLGKLNTLNTFQKSGDFGLTTDAHCQMLNDLQLSLDLEYRLEFVLRHYIYCSNLHNFQRNRILGTREFLEARNNFFGGGEGSSCLRYNAYRKMFIAGQLQRKKYAGTGGKTRAELSFSIVFARYYFDSATISALLSCTKMMKIAAEAFLQLKIRQNTFAAGALPPRTPLKELLQTLVVR